MSLETQLRDAFRQREEQLPDRPGDLTAVTRRGQRRRQGHIALMTLMVLSILALPTWWLSGTLTEGIVVEPAGETEQPASFEQVVMLAPNGDRVEVAAPPQLPTNSIQAVGELQTGDRTLLSVTVDPAWSDLSWPEDELPDDVEISARGERWNGELFQVSAPGLPRPVLLWRGEAYGVQLIPLVDEADELADVITLAERTDGVVVEGDPDVIDDPSWEQLWVSVGEVAEDDPATGRVARERLAVRVELRSKATESPPRTGRGREELTPKDIGAGELYEDGDGRLWVLAGSTVISNLFEWELGDPDQRATMREIMERVRASWEPAEG